MPDTAGAVPNQAALPERVSHVRGPAGRGLVALGTPAGSVLLVDPRAGARVEAELAAHAAGLADLDARADLLATCGYGTRQGLVVPDPFVKAGFFLLSFPPCASTLMLLSTGLRQYICQGVLKVHEEVSACKEAAVKPGNGGTQGMQQHDVGTPVAKPTACKPICSFRLSQLQVIASSAVLLSRAHTQRSFSRPTLSDLQSA